MALTRPLIVIGTGGHARELAAAARAAAAQGAAYHLAGFVDDSPATVPDAVHHYGVPVMGTTAWLASPAAAEIAVIIGIGSSRTRSAVAARLAPLSLHFGSVVHPDASISPGFVAGPGVYCAAKSVVTENVIFDRHVHLNVGACVSHDVRIADFATVAPGAILAGSVNVGVGVEIGLGASVIQGIQLGDWCRLGAGSVVIRNVTSGVTVVGVPARPIRPASIG